MFTVAIGILHRPEAMGGGNTSGRTKLIVD
jgi:hypothetical protein